MAEEIDLEKCDVQNFRSSVTLILTLDRVEVILVHISGEVCPHTKLDRNWTNFLWMDGHTYGCTDRPEFQAIRSSPIKVNKTTGAAADLRPWRCADVELPLVLFACFCGFFSASSSIISPILCFDSTSSQRSEHHPHIRNTTVHLLADDCKWAELVSTFRNKLKTELFYVAYQQQLIVNATKCIWLNWDIWHYDKFVLFNRLITAELKCMLKTCTNNFPSVATYVHLIYLQWKNKIT